MSCACFPSWEDRMATPHEQLQLMRSLAENWDGYGAAALPANVIDLAEEFVGLVETLLKNLAPLPCDLHVSPTRVGGVLIEWESNSLEHEVEIDPDRSISFLHHDKLTGQV